MTCSGTSGALKSIVFANHKGDEIFIKGAIQTGFQANLFGNITTVANTFDSANGAFTSYANTMAEAGMKAIAITPDTLAEVKSIHQACVNFPPVGPLK